MLLLWYILVYLQKKQLMLLLLLLFFQRKPKSPIKQKRQQPVGRLMMKKFSSKMKIIAFLSFFLSLVCQILFNQNFLCRLFIDFCDIIIEKQLKSLFRSFHTCFFFPRRLIFQNGFFAKKAFRVDKTCLLFSLLWSPKRV